MPTNVCLGSYLPFPIYGYCICIQRENPESVISSAWFNQRNYTYGNASDFKLFQCNIEILPPFHLIPIDEKTTEFWHFRMSHNLKRVFSRDSRDSDNILASRDSFRQFRSTCVGSIAHPHESETWMYLGSYRKHTSLKEERRLRSLSRAIGEQRNGRWRLYCSAYCVSMIAGDN